MDVAGLQAEEGGEFLLEGVVVGAGTVGYAGAGRAGAPAGHGALAGLDDLRVEGESEVIVAGEHHQIAAVEADVGALLRLHGVVVRGKT